MQHNEAEKPDKQVKQDAFSLDRERSRIRIMKYLIALFSIILVLARGISMILNR